MFNPTWIYVGALYAGAVWLARRGGVDLPRRVAAFFYALVLVFLYLPMTQDYLHLPVDFIHTLPPWSHLTGNHSVVNGQINDIVLQIVPWAHQVRESWRSLEPPLWNNFSAAGYPLLASAQSSALSPFRLLALPLSLGHAMTAEAVMKILVALTFTFLYCRRRGYSELASTIGAVAFGFSTFIVVWLHFPLISSACWVPAVLYFIDLLAERRTYARFVGAAVVWTLMLFGGHPETASHTFFLAVLYVLWIVLVERPFSAAGAVRFVLALGGAMAVAALLAAPLLGPFAEGITRSKRYFDLQVNPIGTAVPFSDLPSSLLLIQPHFFGKVPLEKPWGPAHAESITGFAGILGIAGWFALLTNVIARRAWRSRELFYLLTTLLVLGVILSWPWIDEVFHLIFSMAANARLRLLLALLLAIQAAAAVDLMRRDSVSVLIGIACAGAILLWLIAGYDFPNAHQRDSALLSILPSVAVLAIATLAVVTGSGRNSNQGELPVVVKRSSSPWFEFRPDPVTTFILLLLVAITAELWTVGYDWNPTLPDSLMYPRTPLLDKMDELKAALPESEPFRIVANGPIFFPNLAAVYGLEDVRAHDPMANAQYINLLRLLVGYDAANYFAPWPDLETHVLDYLNVRYLITSPGAEMRDPRWALRYDGRDGRIFENGAVLPRFYPVRNVIIDFNDSNFYHHLRDMNEKWPHTGLLENLDLENRQQHDDFFNARPADAPAATSEIIEAGRSDYRIHVKAPRYTLIVSSIPFWPGWKVERNGARAEPLRVNGGFLGFAVPTGELDVRVWYDPWTFRYGLIIAAATVVGLIGFGVRRRQPPHSKTT